MRVTSICLLISAATMLATPAGAADPAIAACHGCSDATAKSMAEAQVPRTASAGVYDVYIVDSPGNRLRLYRVTAEREGRMAFNYAQARTPSSTYLGYFRTSRSEWDYVRQAVKPNIVLPRDFPVQSAESVIGNAYNQTVISEQLNRHVPTRIGSLFGAALAMLRTVFTRAITAEVAFPDGTTALFVLDRVDNLTSGHTFVYRYKPGSARDSDGNLIPDSVSAFDNYGGRFSTGGNLARFRDRAKMYGVEWPQGFREELPSYTVCARDDEGNAHCWHR